MTGHTLNMGFLLDEMGGGQLHLDKPVPVKVQAGEPRSNEYSSCQGFTLPVFGTADVVQILQYQTRRDQARIWVNGTTNPTAPVIINNNRAACQAGLGVQIAIAGPYLEWRSQEPLYAIVATGGQPTSVSVMDFIGGEIEAGTDA